jgi:hypothetical protein
MTECVGRCRLTDSGAFFQASLSHLSVSSPLFSLSSSFGTVISASLWREGGLDLAGGICFDELLERLRKSARLTAFS